MEISAVFKGRGWSRYTALMAGKLCSVRPVQREWEIVYTKPLASHQVKILASKMHLLDWKCKRPLDWPNTLRLQQIRLTFCRRHFHMHFLNSLLNMVTQYGSTLAQVMACCLTTPSHYLDQCWLIIKCVLCHSHDVLIILIESCIRRLCFQNNCHISQGPIWIKRKVVSLWHHWALHPNKAYAAENLYITDIHGKTFLISLNFDRHLDSSAERCDHHNIQTRAWLRDFARFAHT